MKRNGAKGKRLKVVAKVWQWLELLIYAYSVLYSYLPADMGGGNPDLGSFLVLPGTMISFHLIVKVWRLFKPAMERLKSRIILKNLPRFARNTLCTALFYMPMLTSIAATNDSGMDPLIFAGVISMISACWTLIAFLCDLFCLVIHYDPKGERKDKRKGKPTWWQGYDIRLHDFLDRSLMPLYFVTGGLYAACLTAEIGSTFSGVEPQNFQILVSLAINFAFSVLMYRLLFRIACRVYAKNNILGALLHVFRVFLCGLIIMASILASDKRIGDLRHNMDFLLENLRSSFFIGALMEFFAFLYRRKYSKASPVVQNEPPEAPKSLSPRNWFDHLQAKGKALEQEAREHSKASVQPAVPTSKSSPEASSEGQSVETAATKAPAQEEPKVVPASTQSAAQAPSDAVPAGPGTAEQRISKDGPVVSGSEGQGWGKVDRWWIDESALQDQKAHDRPDQDETAPGAQRRTVRPGEVSRGQLVRWLMQMEETLQPQGAALGTLAGQRALFEEAEAILPVLSTLRGLPPLARFLFEGATDAEELPERVGALLGGIIDAIRQADLEVINIYWLDLSPEVLVHGWRALSVYLRISTGQAMFDEVLELLEGHLLEREEALNWLCWQCEGVDA